MGKFIIIKMKVLYGEVQSQENSNLMTDIYIYLFILVWKEFNANDLIYSFYKYKLEIYNTQYPLELSQMCFLQKYSNDSKKFYKHICWRTVPLLGHIRLFPKKAYFPILDIVLLEIHQYKRKNTAVKIF